MNAEAGDNLVEDQCRAGLLRDLSYVSQKFARLEIRMATLDRLDQNSSELIRMSANPFERLGGAVIENGDVADAFARNARSERQGARRVAAFYGLYENFIEHAVVRAGEEHYFAAARDSARYAKSSDDRFRARVAEGHAFIAGHSAEE